MEIGNLMYGYPFGILATSVALIVATVWLYYKLFPNPIPGIPYVKQSDKRLLGDAPNILKWREATGETWSYLRNLATELNSPIFQIFMRPGKQPWVVLTDFRESYDIQTSRQGEFDRSTFLGDVFGPLLPGNHVWMPSNEQFRAHCSLIRDTMSPGFLQNIVAPAIYRQTQNLLEIWDEKIRLAQGRPFQADKDIIRNLVDVILSATYGMEVGVVNIQKELLTNTSHIDIPTSPDSPAVFPEAEESKTYTAVRTLVDSIQIGMSSPFPKYHMIFALNFYPSLISARKHTDRVMTEVLRASWRKFSHDTEEPPVNSAVDLLIQREVQMARKENRNVKYDTQVIRDELFGFYLAGHETTSTTLCWAFKHLTKHQEMQQKLRQALYSAHGRAFTEDRLPTPDEIVRANVPYLDAFIEENHRLGQAIPTVIRRTTRDAIVLGHKIPKGTDMFMLMNGPDFRSRGFHVEEDIRSGESRESKSRYGVWDESDIAEFKPERFIKRSANGQLVFDPFAGPVLPYGAGLRGCFGIKLAVIELKVIVTMVVWSFELHETPLELSSFKGYDVNTHRAQQTYLRLVRTKREL